MKFDSLEEEFIYWVNRAEYMKKHGYLEEFKVCMEKAREIKDLIESKRKARS